MVAQNPGMSIFRGNYSPPITSQPAHLRLISGSDTSHDPRQVSFGVSETSESAEGLNTAATNNVVKTFEASALAPNTMRFEKPSAAAMPSSDELKLQALERQLEPLLEKHHELSESIKKRGGNPGTGMHRGKARRDLRQLDKQLEPLLKVYTPLKQEVFDAKRATASKERMGELLTRYQQSDVASRDEIRASTSPKAQNALNAIDYYSTNRSLESMENDPNRPQLNLTEGMGLVHTRMIANFIDGDKTLAAEALFDELAQTPDMKLTAAQEQLLESYGIVPNGKGELINYGSGEVVTADDFDDLGQIMEYQKARFLATDQNSAAVLSEIGSQFSAGGVDSFGSLAGVHSRLLSGTVATNASVTQALMAEKHYDNAAEGLAKALQKAKDARAKLEAQKQDIMNGLTVVEENIESTQNKLGVLENTIDVMKNFSTQEEMVNYLENASPEQKALLDSAGITLQAGANGQQNVTVNGQPWQPGSTAVGDALGQEFARITAEIDSMRKQADTMKTQMDNLDTELSNANGAMTDLETRLESHGKSFANYQEQVESMYALRNDPEQWNALSPEDQQAVNDFLARSESKISRGRELQNEGRSELTKLRETIADTEQVLAQARLRLADVFDRLSQLEHQHQGVGAKVYAMMGKTTEADQKAASMIQKADALARKVELAPKPDHEDVGALIQEWQAILKESAAHFNELAESMSANQRIESERLAHYAAEAKELQEYTQQYLKDVTTLGKGQIEQVHDRIRDLTDQLAG